MKILAQIPSILLAFLFLFGGLNFFFGFVPNPPLTGNPAKFMELFAGTGYLRVIKILEIVGGSLILFPTRRALALVILTPIVVNILLFEIFISNEPSVGIVLAILAVIAIYQERDRFKGIV
jgi:putative oxidoreductase